MEAELRRGPVTFAPKDPARSGHLVFHTEDGAETLAELSLAEAVPALCQDRLPEAHPAVRFWRTATITALELVGRRHIEPAADAGHHSSSWRLSRSEGDVTARIEALEAQAPEGVTHIRAYLDAVADYLALPDMDAGVRISLRIELPGGLESLDAAPADGRFVVAVQVHCLADEAVVVDAADLWARPDRFGPGSRADAMLSVRRAAQACPPLERLLRQQVPDRLPLDDDEVTDLLGGGVERLAAIGVGVRWPEELSGRLSVAAVIPTSGPLTRRRRQRTSDDEPTFDSTELLHMRWRISLDHDAGDDGSDGELTRSELDELARTRGPIARVRDRWVLVDPRLARKAGDTEPKAVGALDALGAALTGTAEIDDELVSVVPTGWLRQLRERIADPEAAHERIDAPAALAADLRDYQLRGLRWLHRMTALGLGACLADDMGLGKTITLIALHLHRQSDESTAGPTLVVCPASLLGNWEREIERFAPGIPVRRYHGADRDLDTVLRQADGGFVVTTYGTMRADVFHHADDGRDDDSTDAGDEPVLGEQPAPDEQPAPRTDPGADAVPSVPTLATAPWGMVVVDEAQHVKNARSKTARALRTISAPARVALTGTPVENNLSELWAILDWTNPGLLGSLGGFRARWAEPIESGREPQATETARRLSRLVAPFLLRRRKSDPGIAPELPPKTQTDRPVALTTEQERLYRSVAQETMEKIRASSGMARRGLILALLTALKQVCNHPAQYLKEPLGAPGRSGKLTLLDELVTTITAENDAVLIFTQYVGMARLIEEHFVARGTPIQVLHGGTPVDQRERMVRRFQESEPGEAPVFVLSLKAAGTGLNLTRAGHVVHYDRWWNPAVEEQATDRAYRIGQTRPVQVHRLIAEGTVEDRIAAMLRTKRELADAVLGSGEAALSELSDAELADLIALDPRR
ncbi:DEAD/DEAH box helicase [Phytoactinopolyspora halotolerans]|uniref:DEAD/DEAH box helicase n=1 Tax=Phytoactinopolyspora halotolerans TaxID=1981512 RepID=A0A6L9S0H6_9ACTN|nr:DEAD/DEAH box helicase [Phytoactinopolyspora halotolerans]NED98944.1 DEAD/DEAH box helicase [Phytoactinopolyspora halotolerans]